MFFIHARPNSDQALDLQSPGVTPGASLSFMRLRPLLSGPFIGELEIVIICDKYWFSFGCIGTTCGYP